MKTLEIVVPAYNEAECVPLLYAALKETLDTVEIDWSVIFVDDGSTDHTLAAVRTLSDTYGKEKVKYISFSRNFGKESAIYAGLEASTADYVVLMDADLQHPPALLKEMLAGMEEGYDCCAARRVNRKGEPAGRSLLSRIFYGSVSRHTSMKLVQGGSDFRCMNRPFVEAMLSLKERERFTKGIMSWVGFKVKWIGYQNVERAAGQTKWSMRGLFGYAADGVFSFATAPLRVAIWLGFLIDIVVFIWAIIFIILWAVSDEPRTGYATILLFISFFGGTIILLLGIIGEYLARIYMEAKKRPIYIVQESNLPALYRKAGMW